MARVEGIDPQPTSFLMRPVFKKAREILGRDLTPQKTAARVAGVLDKCARRMAAGAESGGPNRGR